MISERFSFDTDYVKLKAWLIRNITYSVATKGVTIATIALAKKPVEYSTKNNMKRGKSMSENQTVAIVNGKEITRSDVMKFLSDIGPQVAMQFQSQEGIQQIIDELINQEVLYLDAVKQNYEAEEKFQDLFARHRASLLKDYAVDKIIAHVTVNDDDLMKHYEEHKHFFVVGEKIQASHILIDSEDKANEILAEINGGLSFEEAANKYSSCPSKDKGGDLGEFGKGQMVPEFEEAAFEMEEGQLSGPVKTQFGYHIIKVTKKTPETVSSFEDEKAQISKRVLQEKQREVYMEKIQELRGQYEIQMVEQ